MKTLFILPFLFACSSTSITESSGTPVKEPDAGFNETGGSYSTSTSSLPIAGSNGSTGGQNSSVGGNGTTGVCVPTGNPCETKDYQININPNINTNICNGTKVDSCGNTVTCNTNACDLIGMTYPSAIMPNSNNGTPGCVWLVQNIQSVNKLVAVYLTNPNNCFCGYQTLTKAKQATGITTSPIDNPPLSNTNPYSCTIEAG